MRHFVFSRLWLVLGVGLALGMLVGGLILRPPVSMFASNRIEVGYSVPDFRLSLLDGTVKSLVDYRDQPMILNFWASWCEPCRKEMPLLQQVHEGFGDRIFVVGINYAEPSSKVLSFVQALGITFPILLDSRGEVTERYQVAGFPTTFFVNPNRKLVACHVGELTPTILSTYLRLLEVEP